MGAQFVAHRPTISSHRFRSVLGRFLRRFCNFSRPRSFCIRILIKTKMTGVVFQGWANGQSCTPAAHRVIGQRPTRAGGEKKPIAWWADNNYRLFCAASGSNLAFLPVVYYYFYFYKFKIMVSHKK